MSHFALITPPLAGHMNPTLALARALKTRGHDATYFGQRDIEERVKAAGVGFVCVGEATHPKGELHRRERMLALATSPLGLRHVISSMARDTDMLTSELPVAFEQAGIDAVIADQLEPAGALVALHLDVPFVSLANALPINRDPALPPYFTGWQPRNSAWARQCIKSAEDVYDAMTRRHGRVIKKRAAEWRIGEMSRCVDCLSSLAQLAQIPPEFDFPKQKNLQNFFYVGPIRQPMAGGDAAAIPLDVRDALERSCPLVFVSFGTLFGQRFHLLRKIARACRIIGAIPIIAHGGRLTPEQTAELSADAIVHSFIPQRELLGRVSVCITHAGMNTTMDAISAGVPVLAVPFAFDQKAIAARLDWHGAGIRISPSWLTVNKAVSALERLLNEPSYRGNSERIGRAMESSNGLALATDIILQACGHAAS